MYQYQELTPFPDPVSNDPVSPFPSEADIGVTRDIICAGQLLKIEAFETQILPTPPSDRGGTSTTNG
jgi:hypothetical protein